MQAGTRLPGRLNVHRIALALLVAAALAGAGAVYFGRQAGPAAAQAGSCGTSHDGLSAEESQFLGLLNEWRQARHLQSSHLVASGPLNRAAAWFAQDLVEGGAPGGHIDSEGRSWMQRAVACGYDAYYAQGSGEGTGFIAGSGIDPATYGPAEGLVLVDYPGSGININAGGTLPAKCAGVGVYRGANAVAWVVVIAQWQSTWDCPEPLTVSEDPTPSPSASASASPSASASASATATHTPTASPTPTRTPTRTPTPVPTPEWQQYVPNVVSNP